MKKKTIYLLKIQPKGFNNSIEVSFTEPPTTQSVQRVLNDISTSTKREELKELCKKCITGINVWGLPKVTDNNMSYMQWKTKGESIYSSKGVTIIKPMPCYTKEN